MEVQDNDIIEEKSVLQKKVNQAKRDLSRNISQKAMTQNEVYKKKVTEMSVRELIKTFNFPKTLEELENFNMYPDGSFVNHFAKQTTLDKMRAEKEKR